MCSFIVQTLPHKFSSLDPVQWTDAQSGLETAVNADRSAGLLLVIVWLVIGLGESMIVELAEAGDMKFLSWGVVGLEKVCYSDLMVWAMIGHSSDGELT